MRELSSRNVDVSDRAQAELKNARKRIDELNVEMNKLISQVTVCDVYYLLLPLRRWVEISLLSDKYLCKVVLTTWNIAATK